MTESLCPGKVGKGHPPAHSVVWACESGAPSNVPVLPTSGQGQREGAHAGGRQSHCDGITGITSGCERGGGGAAWKPGWALQTVLVPRAGMEWPVQHPALQLSPLLHPQLCRLIMAASSSAKTPET